MGTIRWQENNRGYHNALPELIRASNWYHWGANIGANTGANNGANFGANTGTNTSANTSAAPKRSPFCVSHFWLRSCYIILRLTFHPRRIKFSMAMFHIGYNDYWIDMWSTGPHAHLFVLSLTLLTHLLAQHCWLRLCALLRSFTCSQAHQDKVIVYDMNASISYSFSLLCIFVIRISTMVVFVIES